MSKRLWTLCLWLTALTVHGQGLQRADASQQASMVQRISQASAAVTALDCRFTQVKTLHFLNDRLTSQGRMRFDARGKLRWEYLQPYQYVFVLNGQQVGIKSTTSRQTIDISQSRLFQTIARVMMNSVTGKNLATSADFTCVMYTGHNEWQAHLTPKRKELKKMFKDIRLHFSTDRQMVTRVDMTEPSGDTTVITLHDVKTNTKIDEALFAMP